jgi:hypothetical protein
MGRNRGTTVDATASIEMERAMAERRSIME